MSWRSTPKDVRFIGPAVLVPAWMLYCWWIARWVGHDCDRQPITCRLPSDLWLGWLDRDRWVEWDD